MTDLILPKYIRVILKKVITVVLAVAFLFNDIAFAGDFRNLAPESRLARPEFKEIYKVGYTLLANEAVNEYIEKYLVSRYIGKKIEWITDNDVREFRKGGRKDLTLLVEKWWKNGIAVNGAEDEKVTQEYMVVSIPGLLKNTSQIGHLGLGRMNGLPVVYMDDGYYYDQAAIEKAIKDGPRGRGAGREDAIIHDIDEIRQYEEERLELQKTLARDLSYDDMRRMLNQFPSLALHFHEDSLPLDELYKEIRLDPNALDLAAIYELYRRHGLAANVPDHPFVTADKAPRGGVNIAAGARESDIEEDAQLQAEGPILESLIALTRHYRDSAWNQTSLGGIKEYLSGLDKHVVIRAFYRYFDSLDQITEHYLKDGTRHITKYTPDSILFLPPFPPIYETDIVKAVYISFRNRRTEYLTNENFTRHMDGLKRDVLGLLYKLAPEYVMNFLITGERESRPGKNFAGQIQSLFANKEDFARNVIAGYGRNNHIFAYGPRLFRVFAKDLAATLPGSDALNNRPLSFLIDEMNGDGDRLFAVLMAIEGELESQGVGEVKLYDYFPLALRYADWEKFISSLERILDTGKDPLVLRAAYSLYERISSADITEHKKNMRLTRICLEAVQGIDDLDTRCWLVEGLVAFPGNNQNRRELLKERFMHSLSGLIGNRMKEDEIIRRINDDNWRWQGVSIGPEYRKLMLDLTEIILHPDRYAEKRKARETFLELLGLLCQNGWLIQDRSNGYEDKIAFQIFAYDDRPNEGAIFEWSDHDFSDRSYYDSKLNIAGRIIEDRIRMGKLNDMSPADPDRMFALMSQLGISVNVGNAPGGAAVGPLILYMAVPNWIAIVKVCAGYLHSRIRDLIDIVSDQISGWLQHRAAEKKKEERRKRDEDKILRAKRRREQRKKATPPQREENRKAADEGRQAGGANQAFPAEVKRPEEKEQAQQGARVPEWLLADQAVKRKREAERYRNRRLREQLEPYELQRKELNEFGSRLKEGIARQLSLVRDVLTDLDSRLSKVGEALKERKRLIETRVASAEESLVAAATAEEYRQLIAELNGLLVHGILGEEINTLQTLAAEGLEKKAKEEEDERIAALVEQAQLRLNGIMEYEREHGFKSMAKFDETVELNFRDFSEQDRAVPAIAALIANTRAEIEPMILSYENRMAEIGKCLKTVGSMLKNRSFADSKHCREILAQLEAYYAEAQEEFGKEIEELATKVHDRAEMLKLAEKNREEATAGRSRQQLIDHINRISLTPNQTRLIEEMEKLSFPQDMISAFETGFHAANCPLNEARQIQQEMLDTVYNFPTTMDQAQGKFFETVFQALSIMPAESPNVNSGSRSRRPGPARKPPTKRPSSDKFATGYGSTIEDTSIGDQRAARPGAGADSRRSLEAAMARMPYAPEWLDNPIGPDNATLRQIISDSKELKAFIVQIASRFDKKRKEAVTLNHDAFGKSYEDAEEIVRAQRFSQERMKDVGWGKSVWTREGPYTGSQIDAIPKFNISFDGFTLEESGPYAIGAQVIKFVRAHFPKLKELDRLYDQKSVSSGYIYDLILTVFGIDAIWYQRSDDEPRTIEIKNLDSIKSIQLVTRPARASAETTQRQAQPSEEDGKRYTDIVYLCIGFYCKRLHIYFGENYNDVRQSVYTAFLEAAKIANEAGKKLSDIELSRIGWRTIARILKKDAKERNRLNGIRNGVLERNSRDTLDTFGGRLKKRLSEKGMLQIELARKLGIAPITVYNWVNYHQLPIPSMMPALTRELDKDAVYLLTGMDKEKFLDQTVADRSAPEFMKLIGFKIRTLRYAEGLTLKEAAKKIGVTRQAFIYWEKGIRIPSKNNLAKLAVMLGTTPRLLLGPEVIDLFKGGNVGWRRVSKKMKLLAVERLSEALGKTPGTLVTKDFEKHIPEFNGKSLMGLLQWAKREFKCKSWFDALKELKRYLSIEPDVSLIEKSEVLELFKKGRFNWGDWGRTTKEAKRYMFEELAGELNKTIESLIPFDFLKPISGFNGRRLHGLLYWAKREFRCERSSDALRALKRYLSISKSPSAPRSAGTSTDGRSLKADDVSDRYSTGFDSGIDKNKSRGGELIDPASPPSGHPAVAEFTPVNSAAPPSPIDLDNGGLRRASAAAENSNRSGSSAHPVTMQVKANIVDQVNKMTEELGVDISASPFKDILESSERSLSKIAENLNKRKIDPNIRIRTNADEVAVSPSERMLNIGVYGIAANPIHWGHILAALDAMAECDLDKVVFVVSGKDSRKPVLERTQELRHNATIEVLKLFAPLFEYSSIAKDREGDTETFLFEIFRLNNRQRMKAHYLVGADHYKYDDAQGNIDTLPKLEHNMQDRALGFDPVIHNISVVFFERGPRGPPVPLAFIDPKDVKFLRLVPFEVSSTTIKEGNYALMPYRVYEIVRDDDDGTLRSLYGIEPRSAPAPTAPDSDATAAPARRSSNGFDGSSKGGAGNAKAPATDAELLRKAQRHFASKRRYSLPHNLGLLYYAVKGEKKGGGRRISEERHLEIAQRVIDWMASHDGHIPALHNKGGLPNYIAAYLGCSRRHFLSESNFSKFIKALHEIAGVPLFSLHDSSKDERSQAVIDALYKRYIPVLYTARYIIAHPEARDMPPDKLKRALGVRYPFFTDPYPEALKMLKFPDSARQELLLKYGLTGTAAAQRKLPITETLPEAPGILTDDEIARYEKELADIEGLAENIASRASKISGKILDGSSTFAATEPAIDKLIYRFKKLADRISDIQADVADKNKADSVNTTAYRIEDRMGEIMKNIIMPLTVALREAMPHGHKDDKAAVRIRRKDDAMKFADNIDTLKHLLPPAAGPLAKYVNGAKSRNAGPVDSAAAAVQSTRRTDDEQSPRDDIAPDKFATGYGSDENTSKGDQSAACSGAAAASDLQARSWLKAILRKEAKAVDFINEKFGQDRAEYCAQGILHKIVLSKKREDAVSRLTVLQKLDPDELKGETTKRILKLIKEATRIFYIGLFYDRSCRGKIKASVRPKEQIRGEIWDVLESKAFVDLVGLPALRLSPTSLEEVYEAIERRKRLLERCAEGLVALSETKVGELNKEIKRIREECNSATEDIANVDVCKKAVEKKSVELTKIEELLCAAATQSAEPGDSAAAAPARRSSNGFDGSSKGGAENAGVAQNRLAREVTKDLDQVIVITAVENPQGIHQQPALNFSDFAGVVELKLGLSGYIKKVRTRQECSLTDARSLMEMVIEDGDEVQLRIAGPQTVETKNKVLDLMKRFLKDPVALEGYGLKATTPENFPHAYRLYVTEIYRLKEVVSGDGLKAEAGLVPSERISATAAAPRSSQPPAGGGMKSKPAAKPFGRKGRAASPSELFPDNSMLSDAMNGYEPVRVGGLFEPRYYQGLSGSPKDPSQFTVELSFSALDHYVRADDDYWKRRIAMERWMQSLYREIISEIENKAGIEPNDLMREFLQHAIPNAIDAVVERIDRGVMEKREGAIKFKFIVDRKSNRFHAELEDNGIGISREMFQKLKDNGYGSTKEKNSPNGTGPFYLGYGGAGLWKIYAAVALFKGSSVTFDSKRYGERAYSLRFKHNASRELLESSRSQTGTTVVAEGGLTDKDWLPRGIVPDAPRSAETAEGSQKAYEPFKPKNLKPEREPDILPNSYGFADFRDFETRPRPYHNDTIRASNPAELLFAIREAGGLLTKMLSEGLSIKNDLFPRMSDTYEERRAINRMVRLLLNVGIFEKVSGQLKFSDMMIDFHGNMPKHASNLINLVATVKLNIGKKGEKVLLQQNYLPPEICSLAREMFRLRIVDYAYREASRSEKPYTIKMWDGYTASSQKSFATKISELTDRKVSFEKLNALITFACTNVDDNTVTILPLDILSKTQADKLKDAKAKVIYINLEGKVVKAGNLTNLEGLIGIGRAYLNNDDESFYRLFSLLTQRHATERISLQELKKNPIDFIDRLNFILKQIVPADTNEQDRLRHCQEFLLESA